MFLSVCIISLLRAVWIKALLDSTDPTWDFVAVSNWTSVEVNASIMCASLLATKPLITRLRQKLLPGSSQRVATASYGRGPATVGSESVRDIRLPSSSDRSARGYESDGVLMFGMEASESTMAMSPVGVQYATAMKEVGAVAGQRREEV